MVFDWRRLTCSRRAALTRASYCRANVPSAFPQLQLRGIDVFGEASGTAAVDTELLMEVLEKRELLAESPSRDQVLALRNELVSAIVTMLSQLSHAFSSGKVDEARKVAIRLQDFTKLMVEVENWESSHGVTMA